MDYLLDTGILLRLVERTDPLFEVVTGAVDLLQLRGDRMITTAQNVSEYWNVSTRPAERRGGYGISVQETDRRLHLIERSVVITPEPANLYTLWRSLVVQHKVSGAKVHDARLIALMYSLGYSHMLTLNPKDFKRYTGINVVTPKQVLAGNL